METIPEEKLKTLQREVDQLLFEIGNNPKERYKVREQFYKNFGFSDFAGVSYGFGNSELAFLDWEVRRGVLNPPDNNESPGSPWWRSINSKFIYYSQLAGYVYEFNPDVNTQIPEVDHWLHYIRNPGSNTWYKAHNTSVIKGYNSSRNIAKQEPVSEQYFINEVLYRLVFAQALVEAPSWIFNFLANPRMPSVDVLVSLPDFYPMDYPMNKEEIRNVTHHGYTWQDMLEDFMDEVLILPRLKDLYQEAARWNAMPFLPKYCDKNGNPVYPTLTKPPQPFEGESKAHWMVRFLKWLLALKNYFILLKPGKS